MGPLHAGPFFCAYDGPVPHAVNLITTLAAGFGLALVFGFIAARMGLPALVGYLLAGVAIGPATPGFVADAEIAAQLAEIGVMLLMFGVGLHFSLDDLKQVRRIALPGAVVQMGVATALGYGVARWWGWDTGGALVFGISLSVASTVVLIKALEAQHEADTANGRIAIGWLVVEDLAMVLVLVLLPALAPVLGGGVGGGSGGGSGVAGSGAGLGTLGTEVLRTLAQVGGFIAFMLIVGRRLFPRLLWHVARTGSRELFTLCVVAAAVGIAYGSAALFGVSFALGAFFAGMVLRESEFSQRAAEQTLPLQDAFAVLFFVSVGMLFDPRVLIDQPLQVLATLLIVVVGKTVAAVVLVLVMRYPLNTALTVGASLAQIGEFSFILAGLGLSLGLLPKEGQNLILAAALLSIALNPLVFRGIGPAREWLLTRPWLGFLQRHQDMRESPLAELPMETDRRFLSHQAVLVGWGRVGQRIAALLQERGMPFVVADDQRERVEALRAQGVAAVWGDPGQPEVLIQAHVREASVLIIATADAVQVRRMCEVARALQPGIRILIRSHSEDEAAQWRSEALGEVFVAEQALAQAMTARALEALDDEAPPPADAAAPLR